MRIYSQFLKIHEKDKLKLITFNSRLIPAFWLDSFRNDTDMKIAHTNQCYVNEPFSLKYTSALNLQGLQLRMIQKEVVSRRK